MRNVSTRAAGLIIFAMGIWGGLVPFVGPYFHFALGPDKSWTWTTGRLWLSVLPAAAAVLGGLMLLGAGPRPTGKLGALLALAAGIWFAIGPQVSLLWNASGAQGTAHGSTVVRVLEMLTYHTLLGSLLAAVAGYALPGVPRRRTEAAAEAEAVAAEPRPAPAAGPVRRGSAERAAVPAAAVGSRATARRGEPHHTNGAAADDRRARATSTQTVDGNSAATTEPPTSQAEPEPVTVRRRRGGLLSGLRR